MSTRCIYKMPKKQVNFKLPQDLIEALDAKAERESTNRTELVIQGIRYILGLSEVQSAGIDTHIHNRIDSIEARLHQIETHRVEIGVDDYRIDRLEDRVSQLEAQRIEVDIYNRIDTLAERMQALSDRLAQIQNQKELAKETEPQILPQTSTSGDKSIKLTLTELAKHLGVDRSNLAKARKNKTAIELAVYTKGRDPNGIAWQFDEAEEVFRPV
jgi:polyhydroxyalkanoate synthesis regulator phasin